VLAVVLVTLAVFLTRSDGSWPSADLKPTAH
jgi:hypothetical protein